MKKILFLSLLIIFGFQVSAQFRLGITAGAQLASIRIGSESTENRFTLNVGLAGRIPLSEGVDLHTQLFLSPKGAETDATYGNTLFKPLYLELPVVFRFKFNTTGASKIFIGGGGFYAYGIGGDVVYYVNGYKETSKIEYGDSVDDDLKHSDMGLVFQLGFEFRENYEGHFFYDMGLKNIAPGSTTEYQNRVFGFNLTWYF